MALTAYNQYGNNTCTKSNYITVNGASPVANFTGTPHLGHGAAGGELHGHLDGQPDGVVVDLRRRRVVYRRRIRATPTRRPASTRWR